MNIQQHIQILRSQLFAMSRLSQRAVDYSVKALELRSEEFCHRVQHDKHEFNELHRSAVYRCCKLMVSGLHPESDLRFALSAFRICGTLHKTYSAAAEIAKHTVSSLEENRASEFAVLGEMGRTVNGLTRLCTVALFQEEVEHAKVVLKSTAVARWFELKISHARNEQTAFERAITKSFAQIAKQAHEMAGAITLWLEGSDSAGFTHKRNFLATEMEGQW
jgi:phosphate uptake regulator